MKVKLVYGAPCSGKSTYVREQIGEHDLCWDYDKLMAAVTSQKNQTANNHPMADFVIGLRKAILDLAQPKKYVENLYITCLWITDKLKSEVEGFDVEEIFIDATKEECFQRLKADDNRPDKGEWKMLINTWFKEHAPESPSKSENKTPRRFWNWLRIENTGERVLRLDGIISDYYSWLNDEITPQAFRQDLNNGEGNVIVYLNSEGGDVFAAIQIYNMLKEYKSGSITIRIDSIAASAASVIAMAGDVVEISPCGVIMIHNPWTLAQGDSEEMKSAAKMLDEVKEAIINAYEAKTHLSRDELSEMMDAETWIHADKAVELGFADKIMFKAEEYPASASISSTRQIMNCTRAAIEAKVAAEQKTAPKKRVNSAERRERLKSLKEGIHNDYAGIIR